MCAASPKLDALSDRLRDSSDFRVRVQAALELGRSKDADAVEPLTEALDDQHASVRAAAAAALGKLGDRRAMSALEAHRDDSSPAVSQQVKSALGALARAPEAPHIRVKLGLVHNGTRVRSAALEQQILSESRKTLGELPGVDVLPAEQMTADSNQAATGPAVMIVPSIQKLAASRDGDAIVYSASIEYIVHTLPDETIMARVSGSASTAATQHEARDRTRSAEVRREVLEAAIRSALKRASRALVAAARL